ncbi:MAG: hypothetical protein ACUBOA_04930 [Candidatus Loosdrechtia sp.]|uniref:hypothetical protein n=1 Tax=Candidatus Loosdrechtia sp. TaxID=3101272 RepID=UPI003A62565C|nr:MAG: hypothetical protein QY305_14280 [Candidatus Jettenia sp. AMX2]
MFHLYITKEDKDILARVLEENISELRMEIANTDSMDFREDLKRQKEALMRISDALLQAKEEAL